MWEERRKRWMISNKGGGKRKKVRQKGYKGNLRGWNDVRRELRDAKRRYCGEVTERGKGGEWRGRRKAIR